MPVEAHGNRRVRRFTDRHIHEESLPIGRGNTPARCWRSKENDRSPGSHHGGLRFADEILMTDSDARREAISTWFLEFSVLWAVCPLLDRFVAGRLVEALFGSTSIAISLTTLAAGLILKKGDRP